MPFIEVDGCFLKRPFGGQLLTADSLDSSSGVFPKVMAVVELECKNSWTFFMTHLETMTGSRNMVKSEFYLPSRGERERKNKPCPRR